MPHTKNKRRKLNKRSKADHVYNRYMSEGHPEKDTRTYAPYPYYSTTLGGRSRRLPVGNEQGFQPVFSNEGKRIEGPQRPGGKRDGGRTSAPNPNPNSTSWRGRFNAFSVDTITETVMLLEIYTLASTAGGVIADVIGNSPSSASNWAEWNTVYGEYRTLGLQVRFLPNNQYSKSTTVCAPGLAVKDRRTSTALASTVAAAAHPASKWVSLENPFTVSIRMSGVEEASFQAVSGPTSLTWVKFYFTGLSVSTTYGLLEIRRVVQFRNIE